MKNLSSYLTCLIIFCHILSVAQPVVVMDKTYGTPLSENSQSVRQTPDGGFALVGVTNSKGAGGEDFYLVKTDAFGNIEWDKTYGFDQNDRTQWAMQDHFQLTYDMDKNHDGYIMVGTTESYANHGSGGLDVLVVRTDVNGDEVWRRVIGGTGDEYARVIIQDSNRDFVICGQTSSYDVTGIDIDVIKLNNDLTGSVEWHATYNLAGGETGYSIREIVGGGYLLTGRVWGTNAGPFLYRIQYNGDPDPTYGTYTAQTGSGTFYRPGGKYHMIFSNGIGYNIEKIAGGYMVVGRVEANADAFMAKLDLNGEIEMGWPQTIPGPGANFAYAVKETDDAGYLVAGETNGIGAGNWDYWVFKTDALGNLEWQEVYGGAGNEWCTSMQKMDNGCFALTGLMTSFGAGGSDFWLLTLCDIVDPAYIDGFVYQDDDGDCSYEPANGEIPAANQLVTLTPGPYLTRTDGLGNYSFKVKPGQYDVSFTPNLLFDVTACQDNPIEDIMATEGVASDGNDFALENIVGGNSCRAAVHIVSAPFATGSCPAPLTLSSPCPGFQHKYIVTLENILGNSIKLGKSGLALILPEGMSFASMSQHNCTDGNDVTIDEPEVIPPNLNTPLIPENRYQELLVWGNVGYLNVRPTNFKDNIKSTISCTFEIIVDVSLTAPYPFILDADFLSWCNGSSGGTQPNPVATEKSNILCSCDPNDLKVYPRGCGPDGNIEPNQEMTYRIRFENIGTGPAHDVFVKDVIDTDLDIYSYEIVTSSHDISSVQIEPGNELVIYFDDIELPPNGKGEFYLRLNQNPNLPEGTTIINEADIYFDFNPHLTTNSTLNTIRQVPSPAALAKQNCNTCDQIRFDFCEGESSPNLETLLMSNANYEAGTTFNWYKDDNGNQGVSRGTPTINTQSNKKRFYWVSQSRDGCESPARRVRIRVRKTSTVVVDLPLAGCSGGQIDLAAGVSDSRNIAKGFTFYDVDPDAGSPSPLGHVTATQGSVDAGQYVIITPSVGVSTYYATATSNSRCQVTGSDVTSVGATSTLDFIADQTFTAGNIATVPFSSPNATHLIWVDHVSFGNPNIGIIGSAGLGNLVFMAQNTGSTSETAMIRVISYLNNCAGEYQDFEITVLPGPANRQAQQYLHLEAFKINPTAVQLSWGLQYAFDLTHFEIEKQNLAGAWAKIGETAWNDGKKNFSYLDKQALGQLLTYRLKMIHADGRSIWSDAVLVGSDYNLTPNDANRFTIYPNPNAGHFSLKAHIPIEGEWSYSIIDNLGRTIQTGKLDSHENALDISAQPAGIYFLELIGPAGERVVKRVLRE